MEWYINSSMEIQLYYYKYLEKCIENNVMRLQPNHCFTMENQTQFSYNNSRIFNELPVICENKLKTDLINYYTNIYYAESNLI